MCIKKNRIFIFSFLSVLFFSCVEPPQDFVAPTWDVDVSLPVMTKEYTLGDLVDQDSSVIRASEDPESFGLLYFVDQKSIESIRVEDNLILKGFSFQKEETIGSIKINEVQTISLKTGADEWVPGTLKGANSIFPESEAELNVKFSEATEFELMSVEKGTLEIYIYNNMPVPSEIRELGIYNQNESLPFAEYPGVLRLASNRDTTISFDLAGKNISNNIEYRGTMYTSGSGEGFVDIPEDAGTEMDARFKDLEIQTVTAPLPEQEPVYITDAFEIDDSTKIISALIDEGSFDIIVNNNLDLEVTAIIKVDNLKDLEGNFFRRTMNLARNEKNRIINISNMSGWELVSPDGEEPSNMMNYSVEIRTLATSEPRTISKNDYLDVSINYSDLALGEVVGQIKPTGFDFDEKEFNLDIGDFNNKFTFDNFSMSNPNIFLNLSSSADIDILLNGLITASNGIEEASISLSEFLIPGKSKVLLNLNDFGLEEMMSGFSTNLPHKFVFSGEAIVNPGYSTGSISKSDSINGFIEYEMPMDIGISNGEFNEEIELDFDDMDKEEISKLNYGRLHFEINNEIPLNVSLSGIILDALGNEILELPPRPILPDNNFSIDLESPAVDSNGDVVESSYKKQIVELMGDEVQRFFEGSKLKLKIMIKTPNAESGQTVKYRISDSISVKIAVDASYRVEI